MTMCTGDNTGLQRLLRVLICNSKGMPSSGCLSSVPRPLSNDTALPSGKTSTVREGTERVLCKDL